MIRDGSENVVAMLARSWWMIAIRGGLAILFGLAAIVWPDATLSVLITLFGVYALLDGAIIIATAIRAASRNRQWWPIAINGAIGAGVGLLALIWPDLTSRTVVFVIAAWAVLTGLLEVVIALAVRRQIRGEWLLVVVGAGLILLGVVLIADLDEGAVALIRVIGSFSIVVGVLLALVGLRLRRWVVTNDWR